MDIPHISNEVEQVSRTYAAQYHIERDATWFILKLKEVEEKWLRWNKA